MFKLGRFFSGSPGLSPPWAGRHPIGPFTILEPQDSNPPFHNLGASQYVVRRFWHKILWSPDPEVQKLWKRRSGYDFMSFKNVELRTLTIQNCERVGRASSLSLFCPSVHCKGPRRKPPRLVMNEAMSSCSRDCVYIYAWLAWLSLASTRSTRQSLEISRSASFY